MLPPTTNADVKAIITTQPEWFEQHVLAACCRDRAFFERYKGVLNTHPTDPTLKHADFTLPQDNTIYGLLKIYYSIFTAPDTPPIPENFAQITLQAMVSSADLLAEQATLAWERMGQVMQTNVAGMVPLVDAGMTIWLSRRRVRQMAAETTGHESWDPDQVVLQVRLALQAAQSATIEETSKKFGDGWLARQLDTRRLQTGLTQFDDAIGGGFAYGEFALGIASTGGGKTICGLQFGATFAHNGNDGIYITTEQSNQELEPRVVSNLCNIPFSLLKDGIFPEKYPKEVADKIEELRLRLRENLLFVNWNTDRSKTVTEDLDAEVLRYAEKRGKLPTWLCFDWIGGGLGQLSRNDLALTRFIYQQTGDKLGDIAFRHQIVVLGFVQANPQQAMNAARVGATHITECKTVGNRAGVIFGISNLREGEEAMEGGAGSFREKQFLHLDKARKGQGGLVPFRRRFDYQRIERWT